MFSTLINPLSELQQMIDAMDQAFTTSTPLTPDGARGSSLTLTLPVDIWEKEGSYYVRAAVPGIAPEDLDIQVREGVLMLAGETKQDATAEPGARFWRREVAVGRFSRSIRLPDNVYVEGIGAEFDNGFVTVRLPMLPEQRKSIAVTVKGASSKNPKALESHPEPAQKN